MFAALSHDRTNHELWTIRGHDADVVFRGNPKPKPTPMKLEGPVNQCFA